MRSLLIGILLAGAAVTPALAQDEGNPRWHRDQQQGDRAERHEQRQREREQQQAQPQQETRGPRFDGGNFAREQQQVQAPQGAPGAWSRGRFEGRPQFVPQGSVQPQTNTMPTPMQVERERNGAWTRGRFGGRPDATPQDEAQRRSYRGPVEIERGRDGAWTRTDGYGRNDAVRQPGWYGQGGVTQPQYRNRDRYAGRTWDRDWRNDRRYDWRRYRDSHRSVFRLGIYIDPFGYNYRPYSIGYRLPPVYFGQRYWIDPAIYNLPYPPPGTEWVRYWNDALLVDVYTGAVIDVIQGFFW